ncbi:MAG: hypothetical protein QOD98_133, partial [Nocardioidaceae bacterium]|nr:hypothetical protein [Nocardioidaceae bacterium]
MTRLRRLLAWTVTPWLGLTVVIPLLAPLTASPVNATAAHRRPPSDHVQAAHGTHKWQTTERVVQVKT